jgi:hypothetical protein
MSLEDKIGGVYEELARGVNLSKFQELQAQLLFLEDEQKNWSRLYTKLDFLEKVGALNHPKPNFNFPISIRQCWIDLQGWLRSNYDQEPQNIVRDDIDMAYLSYDNIALKTKLIMMDEIASIYWNCLIDKKYPAPIDTEFCRLLVALGGLKIDGLPNLDEVVYLNGELKEFAEIATSALCMDFDIFDFIDGKWVIPHYKPTYSNGRHCYLAIPSWLKGNISVLDWNLFY